jgi:hypothetical protein
MANEGRGLLRAFFYCLAVLVISRNLFSQPYDDYGLNIEWKGGYFVIMWQSLR